MLHDIGFCRLRVYYFFKTLLVILLKIVFFYRHNIVVSLSKTFKNEKYLNIKSGLLSCTFVVYCFNTMVPHEFHIRLFYPAVDYIAMKSETNAKHLKRIYK